MARIRTYQLTKLTAQKVSFRSRGRTRRGGTHYPTLCFPFPGMVGVSVEVLSGLGLGAPVLMSPPPACCGCLTDHWPALKEQKATTTKVSARSRYFAGGAFLPDLGLGRLSSSRGSSDVDSRSYCGSGMAERGQAVRNGDQSWRLSSPVPPFANGGSPQERVSTIVLVNLNVVLKTSSPSWFWLYLSQTPENQAGRRIHLTLVVAWSIIHAKSQYTQADCLIAHS